ncbi:hypothetical protein WDV93_13840 [Pantoea ananatis]
MDNVLFTDNGRGMSVSSSPGVPPSQPFALIAMLSSWFFYLGYFSALPKAMFLRLLKLSSLEAAINKG